MANSAVRILFLEDSAIDAELVVRQLRVRPDYRIDWVRDRSAFTSALMRGNYALVLLDYSLPDIDGLQALRLVLERLPEVPVVFISGVSGEEFATEAMARGATDYVVKHNLVRLPAALDRALAESLERSRRYRAEHALRRLNETLEKQVESRTRERDRIWRLSRDLFAVLDGHGILVAANPSWWRILGVQEEQLLGNPMRALLHPDDTARLDTLLETLRKGQPVEHAEMRMRRRDGMFRWISWTAVPQEGDIYGVGRDVTDVKQAAIDLEEATATLKSEVRERLRVEATLQHLQRVEAIGQIAAGVAHDFNNLLAVVLGNTVLLERALGPQAGATETGHVAQIKRAVAGGTRVTRQLLAFSRPQSSEPQLLDLNEAVGGIGDLLKSSLAGSIQFQTQLHESLWSTWVDRTHLEMALLNLVINARDAMPQGGVITVWTDNARFDASSAPLGMTAGEYVRVSVGDTGTGMSPDVVSRAFEPFFTTKEPGQGSGVGLAQVSEFARRSGGCAQLDTTSGVGTTVHIYLPRASPLQHPNGEVAQLNGTSDGSLRAACVLVVDDDPAARAVTVSILADEAGLSVVEAGSGAMALEIITTRSVDALVVDYAMPVMNGAETARLALDLKPDLPIVFLTGYADVAGLSDIGNYRLIEKPCRDDELRAAVGAALRSAPGRTTET